MKQRKTGNKTNKRRELKNCVRKATGQNPLSHLCTRKAQAGLEYLITYGWALVLIAAVVGVFVFLIGNPTQQVTFSSSDPTKILMKASALTDTKAEIKMQNITGGGIEITKVGLTGSYSPEDCSLNDVTNTSLITSSSPVPVMAGGEIFIECTNVTDASGTITIDYTDYAALPRSVDITASGTAVETSNSTTVTYPNGGETLYLGTMTSIQWTASGWTGDSVEINLSTDGGSTWGSLCGTETSPSCIGGICSVHWNVSITCPIGSNNLIKVTKSDDASVTDTSDGTFTVNNPPAQPT